MPASFTDKEIKSHKVKILKKIAEEGLSLRKTCELKDFPGTTTVLKWLKEDNGFAIQYAHACEVRADMIADQLIEICDATADDMIIDSETGIAVINNNVIQRDRLRVDTRKWLLSKLAPKKYGDKLDVTTDGEKIQSISHVGLPDYLEKKKAK